jgi:ribosomal protein S12 methylthiotransferase accessory factor
LSVRQPEEAVDRGIMSVVSPLGGVVARVALAGEAGADPPGPLDPGGSGGPPGRLDGAVHAVCVADLGDLRPVLPGFAQAPTSTRGHMDGAGSGTDIGTAARLAVVEALERYSSCMYDSRQLRWASAAELGGDAIDLDLLPRCSAAELADPRCPVRPPDRDARIRWVQGLSLTARCTRWVPAVMAYLNIPPVCPGELFTLQISTGCAAHVDPAAAVVNAICEVVERDAVSLTWLQRLPLPRIESGVAGGWRSGEQDPGWQTILYDGTTDLGIPTVYGVEVAPEGSSGTAVMCATDLDPARAIAKALREGAAGRVAVRMAPPVSSRVEDFQAVWEGAAYLARAEHRGAFGFLLGSSRRVAAPDLVSLGTGTPEGDLRVLVGRLADRGLDVVVVDLTTDEAAHAGLWVVRAVIPGLQPLSFTHRARFLGHARLYDAPLRMGHRSWAEPDLNPWPQPFA